MGWASPLHRSHQVTQQVFIGFWCGSGRATPNLWSCFGEAIPLLFWRVFWFPFFFVFPSQKLAFSTEVCGLFRSTEICELCGHTHLSISRVYLCMLTDICGLVCDLREEAMSQLKFQRKKETNGAENTLLAAIHAAWNSSASITISTTDGKIKGIGAHCTSTHAHSYYIHS